MLDRVPTKPNRYAVYDDSHNFIRYEYHERADEPTQVGDALNKDNLLPDAVATALGLTGNPQVTDALAAINGGFIDTRKYWWSKYEAIFVEVLGTAGTVTVASGLVGITYVTYYDSISIDGAGNIVLGTSATLTMQNNSQSELNGKYFKVGETLYKGLGFTTATSDGYGLLWTISASTVTASKTGKGSYVSEVYSYASDTYPAAGVQGDYWYGYIGKAPRVGSQIAVGSYTGTGTYGSGSPCSVTFPSAPKFFAILFTGVGGYPDGAFQNGENLSVFFPLRNTYFTTTFKYYMPSAAAVKNITNVTISNVGKTISWYAADASAQLNVSGNVYDYVYGY